METAVSDWQSVAAWLLLAALGLAITALAIWWRA